MDSLRYRSVSARRVVGGRGFTLVEAIVVMGIVVTLAALLLPVLTSVRERGVRLRCAVNLRQIGAAVGLYATSHRNSLPVHYADTQILFDSFSMWGEEEGYVNLGLLVDYAGPPEVFYCPSQNASRSPCLAFDSPENHWRWGQAQSGAKNPGRQGEGGKMGPNASFAARHRRHGDIMMPRWTVLNHSNMVIYTDFIGVDDWPGRGRFGKGLRAPHGSAGYNRLFGDGSALWASAGPVNALRPVSAAEPTAEELTKYFDLLDIMP
ncbi:MAG TPA: type II secretion system protein [Phycisphaerae bacterium]|nr:type II secretion system protein [Phycisphaerae bacterium]